MIKVADVNGMGKVFFRLYDCLKLADGSSNWHNVKGLFDPEIYHDDELGMLISTDGYNWLVQNLDPELADQISEAVLQALRVYDDCYLGEVEV